MPRYWWFAGQTVVDLTAQLNAAGPEAVLEVHPAEGDKLTLHVIAPGEATALKPLNESFPCPPVCR